jgi:hypothetical protein
LGPKGASLKQWLYQEANIALHAPNPRASPETKDNSTARSELKTTANKNYQHLETHRDVTMSLHIAKRLTLRQKRFQNGHTFQLRRALKGLLDILDEYVQRHGSDDDDDDDVDVDDQGHVGHGQQQLSVYAWDMPFGPPSLNHPSRQISRKPNKDSLSLDAEKTRDYHARYSY